MNIFKVRENIKNTIKGKQEYLKTLECDLVVGDVVSATATRATVAFLKVNIDELNRILQDVETCCGQAQGNDNKSVADSWVGEVDRQGGSFTAEEMDPNRGWR